MMGKYGNKKIDLWALPQRSLTKFNKLISILLSYFGFGIIQMNHVYFIKS
jgi:hypothetical protein